MGSKSSSAPPPDPRLVEAQLRSMGIQDAAIQDILAQAKELAPLQKNQMQFALDTNKQAVQDAQADRAWMLTRRGMLSGAQDRMQKDATDFDAKVRTDEIAQAAGADAQIAISNARASSGRDLARRGIMPGSGRSAGADAALTLGAATLAAGAQNNARRAGRAEGYALTDRAANALSGYPAMSSAVSGQGATLAAGGVNTANAGAAGLMAGNTAAAGIAGAMGGNATSMYGAQASYKNQQDQIAANNNPVNTILGAATGVGSAWALKKFF